ncbi:MAG TPA: thiamine pyrophosphate-binding protein [Bryobacteraceae bacterium]|nr:thiamine pyrophosphate-binding protein [Bryobacteraceae bacterium]
MLLSDYVIQFLADKGVRDVFLVSGGGIMYLLDSLARNPEVRYYCNYHEQASTVAAEGYARVTNGVGVCLVTTGPGGANALSAIPAAWVDSIPLLVICGQVKRELIADYAQIRQVGPQEGNIVGMAQPVTKYAKSVRDPQTIRFELEYAWHLATSGRPGPVLLELPLDVQGAQIDPVALAGFTAPRRERSEPLGKSVSRVLDEIRLARRPMLLCGNGIHRARAQELLRAVLNKLNVPVVVPLTAKDVIEEDHPMNMGVFGVAGQRRANFAVQNCDCLVAIGAGLNCQKVGFNIAGFAPKARKVIVDIDGAQLRHQVVRPDVAVEADAAEFLMEMLAQTETAPQTPKREWMAACERWRRRYPPVTPDYYAESQYVNTYVFYDKLSDILDSTALMVTGNALDTTSYFQAFRVKKGQRTTNSGWGAMGWCLPLAIGTCLGGGKRRTLCCTGDGSFQFNVQELLTIAHYRLPIQIFVLNNRGYSNIRATQNSFFERRYVGADAASGVGNPSFEHLAAAYGMRYSGIRTNRDIESGVREALAGDGPGICEVNVSPEQGIWPKASAFRRPDGTFESRPLEDMAPFLSREELWENMHQFDEVPA